MKNTPIVLSLFACVFLFADQQSLCAQERNAEVSGHLIGKWNMKKTRLDMQEGYLILQPDGKYELFERHADGTGVTRKGSFRIHAEADPMRIMIGPDDLDAAGAEWVTNFGIFRFHSPEELEIRFSQTGDYPSEFAEKGDTDTMVLVKE